MRIRVPIVTYTAADELADPANIAGQYNALFENVTGYLESVQYIKSASAPLTNTAIIGVFLATDYVSLVDFNLFTKIGASASFLHPVLQQAVDEDAANITGVFAPIYLSGDNIAVVIDDEAAGSAGDLTGTVILRFSQRDPVRR